MKRIIINFIHKIVKPIINDLQNRVNDIIIMHKKDNNYLINELDDLTCKIDNVEHDYNDYCIELEKNIKKLEKDLTELRTKIDSIESLMPSELHELEWANENEKRKERLKALQTPFKSNDDCGVCDEFILKCAEQQSELDELKKENKELECEYNLLVNSKDEDNINLSDERGV